MEKNIHFNEVYTTTNHISLTQQTSPKLVPPINSIAFHTRFTCKCTFKYIIKNNKFIAPPPIQTHLMCITSWVVHSLHYFSLAFPLPSAISTLWPLQTGFCTSRMAPMADPYSLLRFQMRSRCRNTHLHHTTACSKPLASCTLPHQKFKFASNPSTTHTPIFKSSTSWPHVMISLTHTLPPTKISSIPNPHGTLVTSTWCSGGPLHCQVEHHVR